MSIDATILEVERDGADVVLTLGDRIDDNDRNSIAGQPRLRILNATWVPEPGMDIWGGSSTVQIITKRGERDPVTNNAIGPWYRRDGYTRLHECAVVRLETAADPMQPVIDELLRRMKAGHGLEGPHD